MAVQVVFVFVLLAIGVSASPLTFYKNPPAVNPAVPFIICPDGKEECPSTDTCCSIGGGAYGCCPKPHAVCCSDGVHCCPEGFTCSVATGKCLKAGVEHLLTELVARPKKESVLPKNVKCTDTVSCPDGNTCCPSTAASGYGCCPKPNAVCCADQVHCCPSGYQCDTADGKCSMTNVQHPLMELVAHLTKESVLPKKEDVQSVECPDSGSCPDGDTCCPSTTPGRYGCCPKPNAVCCADKVHCCPSGYQCDTADGKCLKTNVQHPLMELVARPEKELVQNVKCPDSGSCPDGDTCCKAKNGEYGCCPRLNAVCCDDGEHCCPEGFRCGTDKCVSSDSVHPLLEIPAAQPRVRSILCPNSVDVCSDGSTCCELAGGNYGCCPKESGVCCDDGKFCCPSGYKCDNEQRICKTSDGAQLPFLEIVR